MEEFCASIGRESEVFSSATVQRRERIKGGTEHLSSKPSEFAGSLAVVVLEMGIKS